MSRQNDIDVGNSAEYKAERYSAASAGCWSSLCSVRAITRYSNLHDQHSQDFGL